MTSHPFAVYIMLTQLYEGIERQQAWINWAREAASTNQIVQLELDRQETDLAIRRVQLEETMYNISSSN